MTVPPSGAAAPTEAYDSAGTVIDLQALAREICRRYRAEYPDEEGRYGSAGVQWCLHDNQYLLAWAIQDARDDTVVLAEQAAWLADVLAARGFPPERLAGNLRIAAEVVRDRDAAGPLSGECAALLEQAADACDPAP